MRPTREVATNNGQTYFVNSSTSQRRPLQNGTTTGNSVVPGNAVALENFEATDSLAMPGKTVTPEPGSDRRADGC
jgi:hypothetical protein